MQQIRSIQRAIDRIESNLDQPIDIEALARDAAMSYWHFQRTFSAMVGEPIGRYIRRRRLAHAAARLIKFPSSLLDLALDYQFESHEAFTRAFKSEFNVAPSQWRDGHASIAFPRLKETITNETLETRYRHMNLQPEILRLPERAFIGLQARFISAASTEANNLQVIPQLWERFFAELPRIPAIETDSFYGLCQSLESRSLKRQHPDEALYLAAAQVALNAQSRDPFEKWTAPAGLYAKFVHRGHIEKIGQTMGYIYAQWFPQSGHQSAPGPDIERYPCSYDPFADHSELEIFIPIIPA